MGSTKIQSSSETKPTPTAEETAMNKLMLGQYQQTVGPQTQAQLSGLNLINQLLTGQMPQGEIYQQMAGVSPEAIANQSAVLAKQNLAGFNDMGIFDSGVMQRELTRSIANELLFPAEQFNIGAKQNLLNLALSGQASVQQPIQAGTGTLANQLAGLRTIKGNTTQTQSQNPFLTMMSGLGTGIGMWGALNTQK